MIFFDIKKLLWKYNSCTFWGPGIMSIHKRQQFHLTTVEFWPKTLFFRTQQVRNSMTQLTLILVCISEIWRLQVEKEYIYFMFHVILIKIDMELVPQHPLDLYDHYKRNDKQNCNRVSAWVSTLGEIFFPRNNRW